MESTTVGTPAGDAQFRQDLGPIAVVGCHEGIVRCPEPALTCLVGHKLIRLVRSPAHATGIPVARKASVVPRRVGVLLLASGADAMLAEFAFRPHGSGEAPSRILCRLR